MTKTVTIQGQQKWDYCALTKFTEGPFVSDLKDLGQEGWELVTAIHYQDMKGTNCWTGFLKRPSAAPGPQAAEPARAAQVVAQPVKATPTPAPATAGFDLSDDDFKLAPE
jgi:hypothetical protein